MARKIKKLDYDRPKKWSKWDALYEQVRGKLASEAAKGGYRGYLESEHWKRMRSAVLNRDRHRCRDCGSKGPLHVHHKTYKRIGRERMTDLVTLCEDCHAERHGIFRVVNAGSPTVKEAAPF